MKYFFDTEFIEWAGGISLVSIGIVSENGDTFYAESTNFDDRNADDWVRKNVLDKLRFWMNENSNKGYCNFSTQAQPGSTLKETVWKAEFFGPDKLIGKNILSWVMNVEGGSVINPEFYAYYADYDWVVLCRLFGRMIDLPEGFPMYCKDLKQMLDEIDFEVSDDIKMWGKDIKSHPDYPTQENEHDALDDALWNKKLFEFLKSL